MRKFFVLLVSGLAVLILLSTNRYFRTNTSNPTPSPTQPLTNFSQMEEFLGRTTISFDSYEYSVYWTKPTDNLSVSLYPNFSEKKSSREFLDNEECDFLTNAGFYTKEGTPTGFFLSGKDQIRKWQKNDLLNGVMSLDESGVVRISRDSPTGEIVWGVQTGPLLVEDGQMVPLRIKNDKHARRSISLLTTQGELMYAILFERNSAFSGPLLEELPELLNEFALQESIDITEAINLDGGTASAFMTTNVTITEAMPLGAFFCVNYPNKQ